MKKPSLIALIVLVCTIALTACGNGSGGSSNASGPVADAGPDQIVVTGSVVELDGGGSYDPNNDQLTYLWDFTSVPTGSGAVLSEPTAAYPTFTADVDGDYVLTLVVSNGVEDSEPDSVTITASSAPTPAAYWNFEEGSGTTAADSAGTNDGTLTDSNMWVAGTVGTHALAFDGTDNYVSVPHADIFNANEFTLSFWLYSINDNQTRGIFRKTGGWHIRKTGSNELQFCVEESGAGPVCFGFGGYTLPDQQWQHYAIVVDNNAPEATLYVNGESVNTSLLTKSFAATSGDLFIGQFAEDFRFRGRIDDVRFYNSLLAPVEP
jgi:hypothetical protein